jgi:hypothetical protein
MNVIPEISPMQFRIFNIASATLLTGVVLSGIVNNVLSGLCIGGAILCWVISSHVKQYVWLSLLAVMGWVLLASFFSALIQIK